ncbi:MAG: peptidylprolyl isomerase, partial [Vallitaleaceae bacterium]|nr:peptidylprolyl isomerase [Vallitaleaceae bacterium]
MKKLFLLMLVMALISTSLIGCNKEKATTPEADNGEKPLITLEDKKVYLNEALFFVNDMEGQYESQFGADIMTQAYGEGTVGDMVKSQALESTIAINLTALEAEKTGVTMTEEEITAEKEKAKTYFDSIDPTVVAQFGFTLEMMENIFVKYALRNKYMEAQSANIPIDEAVLKTALDQAAANDPYYASIIQYGAEGSAISVRARHILIKKTDDAGAALPQADIDAAYVKIQEALTRAKAGEDFATLVTEYSQDPGSLETGGEYTFARGEFVPEFEAAAYSMEPGKISDIIETSYGYHIIKLEEKNIAATAEKIQERKDYETKIIADAKSAQTQAYFESQYKVWQEKYKIVTNDEMWTAV